MRANTLSEMAPGGLWRLLSFRGFKFWLLLVVLALGYLPGRAALVAAEAAAPDRSFLTVEEQTWLAAQPVLRIAQESNYPPYSFVDDMGKWQGISVDYVRLLEQKLGLRFELRPPQPLNEILAGLRRGEIDVVTSVMVTPERSQYLLFTQPYVTIRDVIIERKSNTPPRTLESLRGVRTAVGAAYAVQSHLEHNYPGIPLVLYPDDSTCLRALALQEVDAAVLDLASAFYIIKEQGISSLRITSDTDFVMRLSLACRKELPMLQRILDKAVAQISPAERQEIMDRWVKVERAPLFDPTFPWKIASALLGFVVLMMGGLLVWNRHLLQQLHQNQEALLEELAAHDRADAALRESRAMLNMVIDTIPQAVFWKDHDGRYCGCNRTFARYAGFNDPVEITGKTDFDLPWTREEAEAYRADDREVLSQRKPKLHIIETQRQADGSQAWVDTSKVPLLDENGRPIAVLGIYYDITNQRRSDLALKESEKKLRTLIENLHAGIVVHGPDSRILLHNQTAQILLGLTGEQMLNREAQDSVWNFVHEDGSKMELKDFPVMRVLANRKQITNQVVGLDRPNGGSRVWALVNAYPELDPEQNLRQVVVIFTDITERKALEQQSRHSQRMEALGTLSGGIAHDLNNILAPMLMLASLIKHKLTDPEDRSMLEMLEGGARRGADIIKQLLTFSRGMEGPRIIVQPGRLIEELGTMIRETFPREISLRLEIAPDLWHIAADPTQVHQVFLNLCVNARDAMPGGGTLTMKADNLVLTEGDLQLPAETPPGPFVRIQVSDTGSGIPPEIRHRIFDPFFTSKPVGQGTGLGLSTVLGIVRKHGGFVSVDSTPRQGSTFTICFPAKLGTITAEEQVANRATQKGKGQMLLVVDDEPSIREASRLLFEKQGYRVLTAIHGRDALEQYLAHKSEIRLILTDLMMPTMNGVDLIKALRSHDADIPILATSGYGDSEFQDELQLLRVTRVLMKPCDAETLLEAIADFV